ncbi:MAG: NAD(P)H-dependent oxidoreductase subunit E [Bacteroidales bacterium]|nr:NAD(P)H-dependent oxidoreductase subunit E [Bacteroidales bacterium]
MSEDKLESLLQVYPSGRQEYLIPALQDMQQQWGYIPEWAIKRLAAHLQIPASTIYGVATFYNQFRFVPKGKYHFQLCYGTACYLFGASTLLQELESMLGIKDGEISDDGIFSLEVGGCLGGCAQAPVVAVNGEFYGNLSLSQLQKMVENIKLEESISA